MFILMIQDLAIQEALSYGQLLTIKIENMKLQHENKVLNESAQTTRSTS